MNKNKMSYNLLNCNSLLEMWAQKGSNLRPPDYESGALTN